MNIFYFGGSSFASQYLVQDLIKKFNVTCFSRRKVVNCHSHYFNLDKNINKTLTLKINRTKPDYIFFFSSLVPLNEKKSNWNECKKTNVFGLINLLKSFKQKPKKIILASSCSIYGDKNKKYNESSFLNPNTSYSLSKFSQENILRIFCNNNDIQFLCFRLGYVYGDNMNNLRLVKKIWLKIKDKKKIHIFNKNKNLNLIHTKDISNMILNSFKNGRGIFNLTTPYTSTLGFFHSNIIKNVVKNKIINNNYCSKAFFSLFKKIKILKFKEAIKIFKDGN
tara:strand:- start:728 stop:1564 length:837 start_codon:yes stop_codon:yes gene_type:complete